MTQHRTEAVKADLIWALHDDAMTLTKGIMALTTYLVGTGNEHLVREALAPLDGMK